MAIKSSDKIQEQLFNKVFTIGVGSSEDYTTQLSELNSQPFYDNYVVLEVVCASLDATVTLDQYQGNQTTFSKMSPILDSQTGVAISSTLTNGNYVIKSSLRAFFLGLDLQYGSATTGTVTIIGRA